MHMHPDINPPRFLLVYYFTRVVGESALRAALAALGVHRISDFASHTRSLKFERDQTTHRTNRREAHRPTRKCHSRAVHFRIWSRATRPRALYGHTGPVVEAL